MRIFFAAIFAVFMLAGLWLALRSERAWPQEIRMDGRGLSFGALRARHGMERVPWHEIEKIDLFRTEYNMAPYLRIDLRQGAFRRHLGTPKWHRFSFGLDINIPVAVDAEPKVVLAAAMRFWGAHGE